MRALTRRLSRIFTLASLGVWAYRSRHTLAGVASLARTAPTRIRMGRSKELAHAAAVYWVLLRDRRLRGADIRVGSIDGSTVVLCAPRTEHRAELARELVLAAPGVTDVRLEAPDATPAPTAPTPPTTFATESAPGVRLVG